MTKKVVHSLFPPVLFDSNTNPGIRYLIADGVWEEVPADLTYDQIAWLKKPGLREKSPAFDIQMEYEVEGSKGKKYKVNYENKKWTCNCEAFMFSAGRSQCKHIKQVIKDIEEGKYEVKD